MKQIDFIKLNSDTWSLFSQALDDADVAKQHDLPKLFRQICHDLAVAKCRGYSPAVIDNLNNLIHRGQQRLYEPQKQILGPLWLFLRTTFPVHCFALRSYILWAHILFYGISLIAYIITQINPEFVFNVMSNSQVISFESMYDPSSEHYAKERPSDSDFLMFGHYILNNISIAFQCFASGLLLGIGSLYYLLFNGIYFGVVAGHIVNVGYQETFFSFVITHGAFELTAIVLSAAAGGVIGMALIKPGKFSRKLALKNAALQTFPIILGCFLLLLVAAFVEAFWSSSRFVPVEVKYVVGSLCWLWMLSYIFPRAKTVAAYQSAAIPDSKERS